MNSLKSQIQSDMLSAMKTKDQVKLSALRMLKAAILKYEVSGIRKEADDSEVITIIKKEIKQRSDAAEQFRLGNRPELAQTEEQEIKILQIYLPQQMNEEQIETVVNEIVKEGLTDFGKAMGAVMAKLKGKADGALVRKVLEKVLR